MIMPASKARTRVEKKLKKNCKKQKRILISAINKEIKKAIKDGARYIYEHARISCNDEEMIKEVEKIFTDLGYECELEINYFNDHLLNVRIGY